MRAFLKGVILPVLFLLLCSLAILFGADIILTQTLPPWRDSIGNTNHTEKITGRYLTGQSASRQDTLLIFGSSELRTTEISTHPVNFFAGKREGFQVDIIGRGSCQSIIHAIQLAASGDSLRGKKVVLITSPQSYVEEGIAPDLFMANFSAQQYLELLRDEELSDEVKGYLSGRVAELMKEYRSLPESASVDPALSALAEWETKHDFPSAAGKFLMTPYYTLSRYLYSLKDKFSARNILAGGENIPAPVFRSAIDWQAEEQSAVAEAEKMTSNNGFGMLDDYYTTYIGSRLERQKDRDRALSYSVSKEYGDLRILFEICRQKGIEPLFIHVPLHGQWSDYTGFSADRRQEYYQNVREIAEEYSIQTLDLTGYEYDQYFMCDVMHLGWKGWLEVDKALIEYYYSM